MRNSKHFGVVSPSTLPLLTTIKLEKWQNVSILGKDPHTFDHILTAASLAGYQLMGNIP